MTASPIFSCLECGVPVTKAEGVCFACATENRTPEAAPAPAPAPMTKEQYLAFHRACCDKMVEITRTKNADYTGASSDPFSNFARVEALGICSTEVGFLTRMTDKLCRIASFVAKGALLVKDEAVEDTLLDLANYCILMAGYLRSKRGMP